MPHVSAEWQLVRTIPAAPSSRNRAWAARRPVQHDILPRKHGLEAQFPASLRGLLMPRYTHTVGHVGRIVMILLIVLLAGGPALASVCEVMCLLPAATTEPAAVDASHGRGHHHRAAAQTPADVEHTAAHHTHHRPGNEEAASSRDSRVNRMLGGDCCTELASPRPSLTASRLYTDLLPGAPAALVVSAAILRIRDRQPAGPIHGPPPGGLLSTRTPLVLRI